MHLKVTTDYAIRILMFLGSHPGIQTAEDISVAMKIPVNYMFALIRKLKVAGLTTSQQGQFGGYSLLKSPDDITVYDVLVAMEGSIKINRCLVDEGFCNCNGTADCVVHGFYSDLQELFEAKLKSQTLGDLIRKSVE